MHLPKSDEKKKKNCITTNIRKKGESEKVRGKI